MLNFTTMLIARMDPLKYIFEKPSFAKQKKEALKVKKQQMTLSRRRTKANTSRSLEERKEDHWSYIFLHIWFNKDFTLSN